MKTNEAYNEQGDAKHYDQDRINTIIKMEQIWGTYALMLHCEITAFKYRERLGKKKDQPIELDLLKAQWYEKAARYYWNQIQSGLAIQGVNSATEHPLPWK